MMERKTALYCRTASQLGCDDGAANLQKARLYRYAAERGYRNIECYADIGVSGARMNGRPAFDRLQGEIAAGAVARVIALRLDRIGRNTLETLRWINGVQANGVEVITLDCPAGSIEVLQRLFSDCAVGVC
jgi:site-specific DNA recombinase